tara:strand:- start:43 stop:1158 length:1116 start_codon:yes stop_codon:yes gene_type:complete
MSTLHLSREVKVYVQWDAQIWEIPVLDGFSFSQSTNTSEVTLKEMANSSNVSRRGRKIFNDSLSPAEWSFSTYARPYKDSTKHHAVEEVLWAMMVGAPVSAYDDAADWSTASGTTASLVTGTSDLQISFASSNVLTMPTAAIYFKLPGNDGSGGGDIWYKLDKAAINECGLEFDIDGITTINWSGMASTLTECAAPTVSTLEIAASKLQLTTNFIRNRLTQLTLSSADGAPLLAGSGYDSLVLTGGSITISNNVEHVTPASLGIVNVPLDHTLGTRTVSGSFTCYLDNSDTSSADLFEDLQNNTSNVSNSFDLKFLVGGSSAPNMEVHCAKAMLEIPSHSVEDVISMEVNFHGMGTDIAATNEVTVKYIGA